MDPERFQKLLVGPDVSVREAVVAIDKSGVEIALVVDEERRPLGTVSDGDVRRALLGGATLDNPIASVTHHGPFTASAAASLASVLDTMTEHAIAQIPLLDDDGRVVDVAFIHDLIKADAERELPRVVLMAGGEGLRLRPLTAQTPKPMLPVGDEGHGADRRPHKIPHIAWNELRPTAAGGGWDDTILGGIAEGEPVYFVHSFMAVADDAGTRLADCDYDGVAVGAVLRSGAMYGCQCHPEKSGRAGRAILDGFLSLGSDGAHA